jgi:hemimethylated DNA binding protein
MTDPKNIPHLIKLLDDESENIRINVIKELAAFGPNLKEELRKIKIIYSPLQKDYIESILQTQKMLWLKRVWFNWFHVRNEYQKLELALSLICDYLSGPQQMGSLREYLDDLCFSYQQASHRKDPRSLARFLFEEKGLTGEEEDYYNPQYSNLVYCIEEKKGNPVGLACIYMLVGYRLGMAIEGCNFPGHFLTKMQYRGRMAYCDCFSGGQFIQKEDLLQIKEEGLGDLDNVLDEVTSSESIIKCFLANLIRSYQVEEDDINSELMIELFKDIEAHHCLRQIANITPEQIICEKKPILSQGMLVRHNRYGYRGIIVDIDTECTATDSWYYSNQSQPERNQPWYHVLVHGSDQVTYVAESNLVLDHSKERIVHPLVTYFFIRENGRYIRNDNPWPESEFEE